MSENLGRELRPETSGEASRHTHLELQSPAALGCLSDAVSGEAAVLSIVRLSHVRDAEHLSLLPGNVPGVIVPDGAKRTSVTMSWRDQ